MDIDEIRRQLQKHLPEQDKLEYSPKGTGQIKVSYIIKHKDQQDELPLLTAETRRGKCKIYVSFGHFRPSTYSKFSMAFYKRLQVIWDAKDWHVNKLFNKLVEKQNTLEKNTEIAINLVKKYGPYFKLNKKKPQKIFLELPTASFEVNIEKECIKMSLSGSFYDRKNVPLSLAIPFFQQVDTFNLLEGE